MESGWVRSGPTGPVMDAPDSPACAECDAHLFTFFTIFIHFCTAAETSTRTVCGTVCGVGTVRMHVGVGNDKGTRF